MTISKVIVLHAFLTSFVKSLPAQAQDHDECKYVPSPECVGYNSESIKKKCPILCGVTDEFVTNVPTAVKEAVNENEEVRYEGKDDPEICGLVHPKECFGDQKDSVSKTCPNTCDAVAKAVTLINNDLLLVDSPVCSVMSSAECNGLQAKHIKKMCPNMCTTDTAESDKTVGCTPKPSCKKAGGYCVKSRSDCDGGTLDPKGCRGRRCKCCIPEETTTSIEEVKEHASCLLLERSDCDGDHSALVKKNCPEMCADTVVKIAPIEEETVVTAAPMKEVTNYPSCVHLMLHDCLGENKEVVKLNCPLLCAQFMGNTLQSNRTKGRYRPPPWAWVEDELQLTESQTTLNEHKTLELTGSQTTLNEHKTLADVNLPPCEEMSTQQLEFSCPQGANVYAEFVQAACPEQCAPYVNNLITIIATDEGEDIGAGVVLDEAISSFMEKKQDDSTCVDIGVASCTSRRVKNLCPVKCASVITMDCSTIESCDEMLVQMLCPKKCGAEGMPKN